MYAFGIHLQRQRKKMSLKYVILQNQVLLLVSRISVKPCTKLTTSLTTYFLQLFPIIMK